MCTHTLWNELDRGAEALRREPAVPPDAERAFPSVEGHDPAQDLEAVLAGPHHAGPEEIGRLLRLGEIHDRLVAVLLELALTERGHRPGCLGLRHTRSATPLGAIRPPHALWRRGPRSVQEPVRLELGRDLLDGLLDVRGLARAGAHDLAAAEHEQDDLRLVDAVHESGELLRLVLDGTEPQGDRDRVEVDLGAEVRRGDDVLDLDLRVFRDRDARGLDLLRDQLDRHLDVLEALRARAHDLPAAEQQDGGLRILDPVDQAGELLRLVLGAAEGEGDRLEVELVPEGSRRDDVLDPELGHGKPLRPAVTNRRGYRHPHASGGLYASVRPGPLENDRTDLFRGCQVAGLRDSAGSGTSRCAPRGQVCPSPFPEDLDMVHGGAGRRFMHDAMGRAEASASLGQTRNGAREFFRLAPWFYFHTPGCIRSSMPKRPVWKA